MYKVWNNFKTTLLMAALMGLCLGVGYLMGGKDTLIFAFIVGGFMNFIAFFFSDKIALAMVGAKEIKENEDPSLYNSIRMLSEQAQIPMPRVYMSPAAAPNAFATGRSPRHSAVCVTAGLRKILTNDELAGVIAHELSHVKHRDILISSIAAVIAGAIVMLSRIFMFTGGGRDRREGGNPLVALLLFILAPIAAMLIQLAISRSREYEADRLGALMIGSGRPLANALRKLEAGSKNIPLPVPDTQANMFIVAPFTGSDVMKLFMTHPPVEKRIERLMNMQ